MKVYGLSELEEIIESNKLEFPMNLHCEFK